MTLSNAQMAMTDGKHRQPAMMDYRITRACADSSVTVSLKEIQLMNSTRTAKLTVLSIVMTGFLIASQLAIASSDSGTLTPGLKVSVCPPPQGVLLATGYISGEFGTYSPIKLTGGDTVFEIYDIAGCGDTPLVSYLVVEGFSSDPGSSWLSAITCKGVEKLAPSATYGFRSGAATWLWANSVFGFSNGHQVSCTIVHK
jgi:hypothetical protein